MINIEKAKSIQGWVEEPELEQLAIWASNKKNVIEIGPWKGRTTRAICDNTDGKVIVVDHWNGAAKRVDDGFWEVDKYGSDYVYNIFYENLRDHIESGKLEIYRMPSNEAAKEIFEKYGYESFDMIWIDGGHEYETIHEDLLRYRPLIKPFGQICGHDYSYPGVKKSLDELLPEYWSSGNIWSIELPKIDILAVMYTWDRYETLKLSLDTMFDAPGLPFRLWIIENGTYHSFQYGKELAQNQLELLVDYYKQRKIETLLLNKNNRGVHFSINQLISLAKLTAKEPLVTLPDFVFQTNDDMIYEPGWLFETHKALIECESYPKGKAVIASPFHCICHGHEIPTVDMYKGYMIKDNICGNTWLMRAGTWIDDFGWQRNDVINNGGDWDKLKIMNSKGWHGTMTKTELAHHSELSTGAGRYNRSGNW